MRPEARDQFLANADATAKALGGTCLQEGINIVRSTLAALTKIADMIQTPELVAQSLDELNITPEREQLLIQLAEAGPLVVKWIIQKLHKSAEETLPTLPNRRPAVAGKTQVEILRFINQQHFRYETPLKFAKKRAAQRFDCSVRTVERYWGNRKRILQQGPNYHFADLLDAVKAAIQADITDELKGLPEGGEEYSLAAALQKMIGSPEAKMRRSPRKVAGPRRSWDAENVADGGRNGDGRRGRPRVVGSPPPHPRPPG
jgi:hypothetical protein